MKLYHVRKGQFVYLENRLHKVYSVKPFFKQSVHLIRLNDLEQVLSEAGKVELYNPQNLDSFVFNHNRYTLQKNKRAQKGDYILIINPRPDAIDHYSLHAIEVVSSADEYGVISNKSNGIKHNEYWLMVPGREEGAKAIDLQHASEGEDSFSSEEDQEELVVPDWDVPAIGDVFQKNNSDAWMKTMVVSAQEQSVTLGGGLQVTREEIADPDKWSFLYNILDQ